MRKRNYDNDPDKNNENEFFVNFENTGFEVEISGEGSAKRSLSMRSNLSDIEGNEFFFDKDSYNYFQQQQKQEQQKQQTIPKKTKKKDNKHNSIPDVRTGFALDSRGQSLEEWMKSVDNGTCGDCALNDLNDNNNNNKGDNDNRNSTSHSNHGGSFKDNYDQNSDFHVVDMDKIMSTSLVDLDSNGSYASDESDVFDNIVNYDQDDNRSFLSRAILGQSVLRQQY